MSKRELFYVNGVKPTTKAKLEQMARDILHSSTDKYLGKSQQEFMQRYWRKYHDHFTEKGGESIQRVGRQKNKYGKWQFFALLDSGNTTDFSFVLSAIYCVSRKSKVKQSMRKAISYQIRSFSSDFFKRNLVAFCEFSGEKLTPTNSHVDHVIKFDYLVTQFLALSNLSYETFPISDGTKANEEGNTISDKNILTKWEAFHEQHAKLRVVSPRANLSILK